MYGLIRSKDENAAQINFKVLYEALCNLESRWRNDPFVEEVGDQMIGLSYQMQTPIMVKTM